ncbi:MAG: hypothetical protein LBD38_01045, partial [Streptococcaceae bacterium]|nr:hypothetical protein [Streptococcaceae bacterium]
MKTLLKISLLLAFLPLVCLEAQSLELENIQPRFVNGQKVVFPQKIEEKTVNPRFRSASYAAKLDPRTSSTPFPVLNQEASDLCWDFVGNNILSIAAQRLTKGGYPDYSIQYYNYLTASNAFNNNPINSLGSGRVLDDGGYENAVLTYAFLGNKPILKSQWSTPSTLLTTGGGSPFISQTTFNNYANKTVTKYDYTGVYYLPSGTLVSGNAMPQNRIDSIKQFVQSYGITTLCINAGSTINNGQTGNMNTSTYATYTPLSKATTWPPSSDHVVSIVGWDDTYPKSNFLTAPTRDGA